MPAYWMKHSSSEPQVSEPQPTEPAKRSVASGSIERAEHAASEIAATARNRDSRVAVRDGIDMVRGGQSTYRADRASCATLEA